MSIYYSNKKEAAIDISKEVCDFETWNKNKTNENSCCIHPNGFYVFLDPDEIKKSDEYKNNDPYTVIENLNSEFHQRRINCTIELIRDFDKKQNLKLLDLGCGQGHFTEKIKLLFPNYDISRLDYSITAIDYAHTNFKGIDFIVANAYHPPYINEYFDVIVCNNLWEHVPDPLRLLNAISRILKPGGLLIISTPSRYRLVNLIKVCIGKSISLISDLHVTEYSIGQVIEQLRFGGYKIKRIFSPSIKERRVPLRIIKILLSFVLKAIGSHHILEATVFYSANKLPPGKADTP